MAKEMFVPPTIGMVDVNAENIMASSGNRGMIDDGAVDITNPGGLDTGDPGEMMAPPKDYFNAWD